MGRTRLAKAVIRELSKKIEISEQRKKYLLGYLGRLQESYSRGEISYAQYIEILYHKRDGRTIREWIEYYEHYIRDCEKRLKKEKRVVVARQFGFILISAVFISIIISSLFYIRPVFLGFAIQEQEFTQTLDFETNKSTTYEWVIENQGFLTSAKLSGLIGGEGEVKIYLDDLLILDSSKISQAGSSITGQVVSEEAVETDTNESYSDELNEEAPKEDSSPSQEPSSSENITEILENITEEKPEESITKEITIKQFEDICEETCDLSEFNLSKSSYTLRIEISNANLKLDEIKYEILSEEPSLPPKEPEVNITEIPENITEIPENITITTQQYQAVIGQPVKWKKVIIAEQVGTIKLRIPKESEKITIKKIKEGVEGGSSLITGQIVLAEGEEQEFFIIRFFKNIFRRLTGQAIAEPLEEQEIDVEVDDTEAEYEIEYETPAPYVIEEPIEKGKRVKIIGPETIHYENVLSFTELDEGLNIKNPNRVKIRWIEQDTYIPIQKIQDTDSNGIYDYIEWIAPVLSEQTFEIIIITKAEHLDSTREFISDIYNEVRALDGIWSETINENDYVRVTFEQELDNTNDITLYPRVVSGTPRIEVYEVDGDGLIAEFKDIISNQYNKVLLTNLQASQDVFDLRVVGGSVEIEHIIDPFTDKTYFFRGSGGSGPYTDALELTEGTGEAYWTIVTDTDILRLISSIPYPEQVILQNGSTINVSVWCNATDVGVGRAQVDLYRVLDCDDSICSTSTEICSDATNHDCKFTAPTLLFSSACAVGAASNYTIASGHHLAIELQGDYQTGKNPHLIIIYNSTAHNSNITIAEWTTPVSDTEYPQFSGYTETPSDATYSSGASYEFNATITSTNGTVWIRFGNTNYSATNLTETMYNVSIKDLAAGTYYYNWSAYGNGSQKNFNMSDTYSYTINQAASEVNLTLDYNQTNITIFTGTTIDLNCTTITGEGSAYLAMYQDETLINNGTSSIGNRTTFNSAGVINFTCFYEGSQNYSWSYNESWLNVTDNIPPNVTINTPLAQNYSTNSITFNVTALDETGMGNCSYSLSNGVTNYSLSNASDAPEDWFGTNSSMMQGWINANFSCNDTSGNQNNTESVRFFIDSIFPEINITTPSNYTNTSVNTIDVKYTYIEDNCDSVWYSNDSYSENLTLGCGNNITDVTWSDAQHNVTIWINDTVNNVNYSIVTFTVDTTYPEINITTPINNTVVADTNQDINYTYTEINPDSCWYTNDTNLVNITLTNCTTNITTLAWSAGEHNVTIWINDTANQVNSTYVNFSISGTAAPTITQVWNGSASITLADGPSNTNLSFNFSVTDTNGISDLVNESVSINISKAGLGRINNSACAQYQASGNDANYTCNVTMWWWDSDGAWIVNVSIKDTAGLWASNDTTNITINMVTGFVVGPGNLTWATLDPGSTNQTPSGAADNWITLNNTGNQNISYNTFQINATNLTGETTPSQAIWAANFSVGNLTGAAKPECDSANITAQNMSASAFVTIAGAVLPAGNYTVNNNVTGQENLYFCIRKVGLELSEQRYSTLNEGAWTIRILLVAVTYRRRKKRKKKQKSKITDDKLLGALDLIVDKLKEEYDLDKEEVIKLVIEKLKTKYNLTRKEILKIMRAREDLIVPINIFSKELGGLEAITKFMKENLNMSYSEIAKELGRNERTIWTAYKKATEKQKEPIKVKGTRVFLPISIFENKELTILESLVVYLKKRGMKYTEIAGLLNRDQRNIWTIYSRAIKKLNNKNI